MAPTEMTTKTGAPFDRAALESLMKRRYFYTPAFEIYGGVAGLYDYINSGEILLKNIIDVWREHFVDEEDMITSKVHSITEGPETDNK
jgi:glycyl-tRNA synthetase